MPDKSNKKHITLWKEVCDAITDVKSSDLSVFESLQSFIKNKDAFGLGNFLDNNQIDILEDNDSLQLIEKLILAHFDLDVMKKMEILGLPFNKEMYISKAIENQDLNLISYIGMNQHLFSSFAPEKIYKQSILDIARTNPTHHQLYVDCINHLQDPKTPYHISKESINKIWSSDSFQTNFILSCAHPTPFLSSLIPDNTNWKKTINDTLTMSCLNDGDYLSLILKTCSAIPRLQQQINELFEDLQKDQDNFLKTCESFISSPTSQINWNTTAYSSYTSKSFFTKRYKLLSKNNHLEPYVTNQLVNQQNKSKSLALKAANLVQMILINDSHHHQNTLLASQKGRDLIKNELSKEHVMILWIKRAKLESIDNVLKSVDLSDWRDRESNTPLHYILAFHAEDLSDRNYYIVQDIKDILNTCSSSLSVKNKAGNYFIDFLKDDLMGLKEEDRSYFESKYLKNNISVPSKKPSKKKF